MAHVVNAGIKSNKVATCHLRKDWMENLTKGWLLAPSRSLRNYEPFSAWKRHVDFFAQSLSHHLSVHLDKSLAVRPPFSTQHPPAVAKTLGEMQEIAIGYGIMVK